MLVAGLVKRPPATISPFGRTARAVTYQGCMNPETPVPRADQAFVAGEYRAMLFAGTPPAVVKVPPAMMSPLGSTAIAPTGPPVPDPKADQVSVAGEYRARLSAETPPAVVKEPPAMMSPFWSRARVLTPPFVPDPRADQVFVPGE